MDIIGLFSNDEKIYSCLLQADKFAVLTNPMTAIHHGILKCSIIYQWRKLDSKG